MRARLEGLDAVFFSHPEGRRDVYEEAENCKAMGRDAADAIDTQVAGLRALASFSGCGRSWDPIPAGMVMLRRHHSPAMFATNERWCHDYLAGPRQDKISLPAALCTERPTYMLYQLAVMTTLARGIPFFWLT